MYNAKNNKKVIDIAVASPGLPIKKVYLLLPDLSFKILADLKKLCFLILLLK